MSDVTRPGREMSALFQSLGDMVGKTSSEIISVVGPPNSRSLAADDCILLQWQATGYHIALLFDSKDYMITITHEFADYEPEPNYGAALIIGFILIIIIVAVAIAMF